MNEANSLFEHEKKNRLPGVCSSPPTVSQLIVQPWKQQRGLFYLQLLVLQQLYHQRSDVVHRLLVAREGEQVVKHHYLEVREHRVTSVPGAASGNLQGGMRQPSSISNNLITFRVRAHG